jgi:hypothetical protein
MGEQCGERLREAWSGFPVTQTWEDDLRFVFVLFSSLYHVFEGAVVLALQCHCSLRMPRGVGCTWPGSPLISRIVKKPFRKLGQLPWLH